MANFKEATLTNRDKVIINMDQIRAMHWIPDTTTISFDNNHAIQITETPGELLARPRIPSMN